VSASARPDETPRLRRQRDVLGARHRLLQAIRAFFVSRDFLEVETPVRIAAPANEDYINAEPAGDAFLRASPELHMKRLLAAGYERIFQVGPCFRQGERGRRHLPEFTMLEWYRANADYRDILRDTVDMVRHVADAVTGGPRCRVYQYTVDLEQEWEVLPVEEAFRRYAEADVDELVRCGRFDEVLVERVEPQLGLQRPTVLIDYPAQMAALARRKPDNASRAERWELYIGALEIANAFSELTDYDQQTARFRATAELRSSQDRTVYPEDPAFMDALRRGLLPPSGGIALGVDRLLMALTGREDIADVVAFPH
jgi:lysyl-tRNA synthetase class 2